MRLLDRIIRAVLLVCMTVLSGYILIRAVTIAGENGVFQDTPLLSALYRKLETYSEQFFVPALYYDETAQVWQQDLRDRVSQTVIPYSCYVDRQGEQSGQKEPDEEYELILEAEAKAEEQKQPLDLQEWMANQKQMEGLQKDESEKEVIQGSREEEFAALLNTYFSMDAATTIDSSRLNNSLLDMDLSLDTQAAGPQILIYHSHSQEGFTDTVEGDDTTTIVGVGDYLTQLLTEQYGYEVIHDRGVYDLVDGVLDRNVAYDYAGAAVEKWLEKYPQIQVIIDLHRDGVDGKKFVTEYQGKQTANLMFILGMSQTADHQDITYLPNPYIKENTAFALQMQIRAEMDAPGVMRNIYLMAYRFNLHYRPRSILLEAGTQLNSLEEEKNAMDFFAQILDKELKDCREVG